MKKSHRTFFSLFVIVLLPLAIAVAFPFEAFSFHACAGLEPKPHAVLVRLTPEQERTILERARAVWQLQAVDSHRSGAGVFSLRNLPPETPMRFLEVISEQGNPSQLQEYALAPWAPSCAAAKPDCVRAASCSEEKKPFFSREDLLQIK